MGHNEPQPQVSLPPEVADWMGADDAPSGTTTDFLDVPVQRGWRERLKDLLADD